MDRAKREEDRAMNRSRIIIGVIAAASFVTLVNMLNAPKPVVSAAPVAVAAPRPMMSDGCELAGAMPNCKEEMAKLMAEQTLHPPEYHGAKPGEIASAPHSTRASIDNALEHATHLCNSLYDGPSDRTQLMRATCVAGAQASANDAMAKLP
jgi:hypothetical protein